MSKRAYFRSGSGFCVLGSRLNFVESSGFRQVSKYKVLGQIDDSLNSLKWIESSDYLTI